MSRIFFADNLQRPKQEEVKGRNARISDRQRGIKMESVIEDERDTIIIPTDKHKWKETKCSTNASS